ncbi:MAG: hypothetical protein AB2L22_13160 [Syntrophales bacterium]
MIFQSIIPDYTNRNTPTTFTYALPAIQYLYPKRYGYAPRQSLYPLTSPLNTSISSIPTGLEGLLYQRQEVIHSKIRMVLSEIDQRRTMMDYHINRIDLDQCTCRNLIYFIGKHYMDRRRVDIEKKIIDLEQEKRRERAAYFRDILFLRKELRESFIEKLEEDQRAEIFMNPTEEPQ